MNIKMRAKFSCNSVESFGPTHKTVRLSAVHGGEKNTEDNQFAKATPSGKVEMTISNPNAEAQGFFEPGKSYYLDFTEAV